jgi:phosphocarrier protein
LESNIIKEKTVEIINELGLHARAAATLVKVAAKFQSEITIEKDGIEANGKSIMGIMMLAAPKGSIITIKASGDDADAAVKAIVDLINNKFGEDR